MEKAKIQLKRFYFPDVRMESKDFLSSWEEMELKLNIKNSVLTDEKDKKLFRERLDVSVIVGDKLEMNIVCIGEFSISQEIDDEFLKGNFPNVNAPAILFPFVRSFVSYLATNAGYPQVVLPAINFANNINKEEKRV
jgi:Preprotein translocase subunit SecB